MYVSQQESRVQYDARHCKLYEVYSACEVITQFSFLQIIPTGIVPIVFKILHALINYISQQIQTF